MLGVRKTLVRFFATAAVAVCGACAFSGSASAKEYDLYLGGFPAGFMLETSTVEVVGIFDVMSENGLVSPAKAAGIRTGDVILSVNGNDVTSSEALTDMLDGLKRAEVRVLRGGEELQLSLEPVKDVTNGRTRAGVLVRDSVSGVGTVTYIDKASDKFGSLGHPVTDGEGNVTGINGGTLYKCVIYDVKRGVRGTPGELKGAFENSRELGNIAVNSASGVFGTLSENCDLSGLVPVKKGNISEVTPGKAVIYSTVEADRTECYDISIVKVDKYNRENKNYVIKINDPDLISATGGIVQGMSGSPIVQNGKLVGAVTHVFINDPTRGYGISIDNMLDAY